VTETKGHARIPSHRGVRRATLFVASAAAQTPVPPAGAGQTKLRSLAIAERKWTGDFDGMLERRIIRVAVPYSRSLYYNDKGRERGITAENIRDFERWLNQKYAKQLGKRPITLYIIPTTRDDLIPDVADGIVDIAAGNITVTEQRLKLVDFVAPEDQKKVSELVVSRAPLASCRRAVREDRARASVVELLQQPRGPQRPAEERGQGAGEDRPGPRRARGRGPDGNAERGPDGVHRHRRLEGEDVGAGPPENQGQRGRGGARRRRGGWAVRKGSPKLEAELNAFYKDYLKKQGIVAYRLKQHMSRVKQINNNAADAEFKKFQQTLDLFRKYGEKYGFDPVMLAAQGYQESQLNQNAKSHVGAIGVMQIMPATGAELKVGDITQIEPNIHGGAKYMDKLMTSTSRTRSSARSTGRSSRFASYNAGPATSPRCARRPRSGGLDPDKWFNNVELVDRREESASRPRPTCATSTSTFVSFKMTQEARQEQQKAREAVGGTPPK